MKKVLFTSILLLSAVSFGGNIYAQDQLVVTPLKLLLVAQLSLG